MDSILSKKGNNIGSAYSADTAYSAGIARGADTAYSTGAVRKLSLACVIIGTPGDGESTKPLSHATKTSLDQQFSERRPEFASRVCAHYTSPKFLSSGLFDGFTVSLFGGFAVSLFGTLSLPATAKAVSA